MICRLARERGIKVLLSGAGGDDIFTGYRRHYALRQERFWAPLPASARRGLKALAGALPVSSSLGRRVAKAFQYADLDGDERLASYFLWAHPSVRTSLYGPAMRDAVSGADALRPLLDSLASLPPGMDPLNRMLYLEGRHFLADHNLNYTDKMSMATGVEVRVPLLDPDLVALAARLPTGLKQKGAVGKWIFKKAMEPHLPKDVIYRPKVGFGAPLRAWMSGELAPMAGEVLSRRGLEKRGLFDPDRIAALSADTRAGRIDGTYTLFTVLCIELWCRLFLDGRAPASPEAATLRAEASTPPTLTEAA
jgi:asparagine synthase (glutamine-hydrolysing)